MHKMGPQARKHYIFGNQFYLKNVGKLRFHVILNFHAKKHDIIILPEVDEIHKILLIFAPI